MRSRTEIAGIPVEADRLRDAQASRAARAARCDHGVRAMPYDRENGNVANVALIGQHRRKLRFGERR